MHNKFINSRCPGICGCNLSLSLCKEVWVQDNMHSERLLRQQKTLEVLFLQLIKKSCKYPNTSIYKKEGKKTKLM